MDRWNLRPQERRLVVVVAAIFFVMLNMWFVWPHFKDWRTAQDEIERNQRTLNRYRLEVANIPDHEVKLKKLEGEGSKVLPAEQSIDLLRTVQTLAKSNQVDITRSGQPIKSMAIGNTNAFFEELSLPIDVITGEKALVDFLYNLGSGNSMIRVRDLTLNPAPSGTNLVGRVTLVASYQKQTETKPASDTAAKINAPRPVLEPKGKTNAPPPQVAGHSATSTLPRLERKLKSDIKSKLDARISTNMTKRP